MMNCIIPAQNIKILSKTINALAKVGDEIYLEANSDELRFTTLNMSKTVCSQSSFSRSFFSSYEVKTVNESEDSVNTISCKVFMKSLLPLFKGNLEKKLEFLKIEFEGDNDFIVLKMKYKFDQIMMVHKLRLMDSETLCIGITPNSGMNNLCASSSLFNEILSMFSLNDNEITLEIINSKLIARNYYTGAPPNPKLMRAEVKVSAGGFLKFDVENNININFALKPLRTVISFAECFNLHIGLNFDSGGKPLTLLMKHATFTIHFIVSTLNPNRDMQSSLASTSALALTPKITDLNVSSNDLCRKDTNFSSEEPCADFDTFPPSPESPRSKRIKLVFGRCYEPTIVAPDLGKDHVGNSDSE